MQPNSKICHDEAGLEIEPQAWHGKRGGTARPQGFQQKSHTACGIASDPSAS